MAFQKGISGNSSGKKPGTLNKKTVAHLDRAAALIEKIENHPKFQTMLDTLTDKEFSALYTNLLEYTQPRLARSIHTDGNGGPLVLTVLTSPAPTMLPVSTNAEQIEYTEIKSLPSGAKPF